MTGTVAPSLRCMHCGGPHDLRRCPDFLHKNSFARKSIVDKCKACLSNAHTLSQCLSSRNCIQCDQRHHTLLHFPQHTANTTMSPGSSSADTDHNFHSSELSPSAAPLQTALVINHNNRIDQSTIVRALVNSGSEGTIITERFGLKRHPAASDIAGVAGLTAYRQALNRFSISTFLKLIYLSRR